MTDKKKIKATLYMLSKIAKNPFGVVDDPHGCLFSGGIYRTKILPEDLPEWYVYGYLYKRHGFISAKDVKHLLYVPNYAFDNHLYKDDLLLISYYDEIVRDTEISWYTGYDHIISGSMIEKFVTAAEKYSQYNVSDIRNELVRKRQWYHEQNPEDNSMRS